MPATTYRTVVGVVLPNILPLLSAFAFVKDSILSKHDFGCRLVDIALFASADLFRSLGPVSRFRFGHRATLAL